MRTARARVVERTPDGAMAARLAYEILDGPEAGVTFYASDRPHWLVDAEVEVTYYPADQFARRSSP